MTRMISFPFLLLLSILSLFAFVRAQDEGVDGAPAAAENVPRTTWYLKDGVSVAYVTTWAPWTGSPSPVPAGTILDISSYVDSLSRQAASAVGTNTAAFASLGLDGLGKNVNKNSGSNIPALAGGLTFTIVGIVAGMWIAL